MKGDRHQPPPTHPPGAAPNSTPPSSSSSAVASVEGRADAAPAGAVVDIRMPPDASRNARAPGPANAVAFDA
ncbi:hypothetical protein JZU54_06530, partial [bacterium]|nr:hypothetical protein [bacterium]